MSETILLVEDDVSIRKALQLNLQLEGYELLCAEDGEIGRRRRAWRCGLRQMCPACRQSAARQRRLRCRFWYAIYSACYRKPLA